MCLCVSHLLIPLNTHIILTTRLSTQQVTHPSLLMSHTLTHARTYTHSSVSLQTLIIEINLIKDCNCQSEAQMLWQTGSGERNPHRHYASLPPASLPPARLPPARLPPVSVCVHLFNKTINMNCLFQMNFLSSAGWFERGESCVMKANYVKYCEYLALGP